MVSMSTFPVLCARRQWLLTSRLYGAIMHRELHDKKAIDSSEALTLVADDKNGVRRITMNSVKKRNALSCDMLDALIARLAAVNSDKNVRVVILCHNGPVFSAGHNLKELSSEHSSSFHRDVFDKCSIFMKLVQDISVPVIAEVKGVATAAGCQLVASCDLAVASKSSTFATPGVFVGLFCSTPGVAVARSMHRKHAMKMLLTGESISADDALKYGLINEVVADEDVEKACDKLAMKIIAHSGPVISLGKKYFYRQIGLSRDDAYDLASKAMVENLALGDAQEGISAFFSKRHPVWGKN